MTYLRYYFRLFLLSFFLIAFSQCGTPKKNLTQFELSHSVPFTIGKVYSQRWVAGTPEGGSGTNLFIPIRSKVKGIEFKEVHFQNKVGKLSRSMKDPELFMGYFNDKNSIDVIISSDPKAEAKNIPPPISPFQLLNNEAVIGYLRNKKMHYFKITEIAEKPLIAYPGTNPYNDGFPEN